MRMREHVDEADITRINGASIHHTSPRLLIKENQPEIYRHTAAVLQSTYIIQCLTGVRCMDVSRDQ